MAILSVNIDHVATLRQARLTPYPDPVAAACMAEKAGAGGITFHLREDRRHIQDDDLPRLKKSCSTRLNMEMAATEEMLRLACTLHPHQVTLVPEKRQELTTEGGLKLSLSDKNLKTVIKGLQREGIRVSLFIDPLCDAVTMSKELGADAVELNTGAYADAVNAEAGTKEFEKILDAGEGAAKAGLELYAGHGLTVGNIKPLLSIREITEYNIGHSLVSRALFIGFSAAVSEMNQLITSDVTKVL